MSERPEYVAGSRDSDHVHHYGGQSLHHSHPHTGAHGYFEHPEDGAQPETQLATDLVRAEAAIARVRAIADRWKDEASARGPHVDKIFTAGAADMILMALDGAP